MIRRVVNADWQKVQAICAPTGSGKSPIGLGIAILRAREGGPGANILTHQRALQDQYLEYDVPEIRSATGRQNWPCILDADFVEEDTRADKAPCVVGYSCHHADAEEPHDIECPYYRQRALASIAPVRILNYAYYFLTQKHFPCDTLICDEGHRLDKAILDANSVRIHGGYQRRLAEWGTPLPDIPNGAVLYDLPNFKSWVSEALRAGNEEKKHAVDTDDEFAIRMLTLELLKLLRLADKTVVVVDGSQFLPVLPEEHARETLLSGLEEYGGKLMLMSASLFDPQYVMARIGYDPWRVEYTDLPSQFPVENRLIRVYGSLTLNRETTSDPAVLTKLAETCDDIADAHPEHRGVIHCASFQLGREIALRSRHRHRMVLAESGNTHVEEFKQKNAGIYVSPSAYEGYDFKGDLCRFNIMAKLNWPNRGDPVTKLQLEKIPEFNDYETASAFVQGMGRGNRTKDDWCNNYVLDKSFYALWGRYGEKLPSYIREAVVFP